MADLVIGYLMDRCANAIWKGLADAADGVLPAPHSTKLHPPLFTNNTAHMLPSCALDRAGIQRNIVSTQVCINGCSSLSAQPFQCL